MKKEKHGVYLVTKYIKKNGAYIESESWRDDNAIITAEHWRSWYNFDKNLGALSNLSIKNGVCVQYESISPMRDAKIIYKLIEVK